MTENMDNIKKEIDSIDKILATLNPNNNEYRTRLLTKLDRLSYHYYKAAVAQMRSMGGDGDGI